MKTWSAARGEARLAMNAREHERADALLDEAELLLKASTKNGDHAAWASIIGTRADLRIQEGLLDDAIDLARSALEHERQAAAAPIFVGNRLMFLAQLLVRTAALEGARSAMLEAIPLFIASFGDDHQEVRHVRGLLVTVEKRLKLQLVVQ